jgi:hypothetical protein
MGREILGNQTSFKKKSGKNRVLEAEKPILQPVSDVQTNIQEVQTK